MARMRTLKPEACTSETLAEVPREVRWTFAALWTHLDDDGRAVRNLRLIKAAIYPLDDDVTPLMLDTELHDLEKVGCLCSYEVDGKSYIHAPAWDQRPNHPVKSKLPPCPRHETDSEPGTVPDEPAGTPQVVRSADDGSPQGDRTPVVVVGEVGVVGVVVDAEGADPTPRKRGTRITPDWKPPSTEVEWRRENGITDLVARRELPKFVDYWTAKAGREAAKVDWLATWRNWLRNAQEREPENRHGPPGGRYQDTLAALSRPRSQS